MADSFAEQSVGAKRKPTTRGRQAMPRCDNLPPQQLETIRKFIEEADAIDAANPAELDDLRALVAKHWPHLLHKLPPHTEH
jgi:hypothetical protein